MNLGYNARLGSSTTHHLAIVDYPTCDMPASRIVVRPMNDAALFVPDILAVEANAVADRECVYPRREVDVVRNEERLS